jgi:cytoskeletal protein CcmA (bactofilin family)
MWRRQNEPRHVSPEPEAYVPPPAPRRGDTPGVPVAHAPEATRITQAISIRGEISGQQDLFIDGELQGSIRLPDSRVTVGPNGRLNADIEAAEIVVEGQVKGSLTAGTRVVIRRTGRVQGNVATHRIAIEEGAIFNGQVDIARAGEPQAARASSVAASATTFRAVAP